MQPAGICDVFLTIPVPIQIPGCSPFSQSCSYSLLTLAHQLRGVRLVSKNRLQTCSLNRPSHFLLDRKRAKACKVACATRLKAALVSLLEVKPA